jgi:hypothetical protein
LSRLSMGVRPLIIAAELKFLAALSNATRFMIHIRLESSEILAHKLNRIEHRHGHRNCLFKSIVVRSIHSKGVFGSILKLTFMVISLVLCSIPMGIFCLRFQLQQMRRIVR